ncbi:MAG: hypothetical protein DRI90_26160 [Deltaproteobacteria bacterium]|nr:MAG: hypothetical protein DRI90_26160 [Deltaproteobacteria bacterium]
MSDKDEDSDRRIRGRRLVCVTAEVRQYETDQQVAVIHDMSESGVYLHAQAPIQEGETVALSIRLTGDPDGPTEETTGEVVRVDTLSHEQADFWTHGIAIRFQSPLTHLETEIEALAERLNRAGVRF